MLSGEPEYLDVLKDETSRGWIVTGYPWDQIDSREHASFAANYYRRFKEYPKVGSVVGYSTMQAIFAGIKKANSTDNEKLVTALRGLKATSAAAVQLSVPVFAAIGGIALLGESISLRLLIASAAILGGIALVIVERSADNASLCLLCSMPTDVQPRRRTPPRPPPIHC